MDVINKNEMLVTELLKAGLAGKPHLQEEGDRRHVRNWVSHQFKCAYCGADLLTDLIRMFSTQLDHLLPKAKYEKFNEVEQNWVLSCFPCNQLKRAFDPWEKLKGKSASPTRDDLVTYRYKLIEVSKEYIQKKRDKWEAMLSKVKSITESD